ncbi:hypothetical protein M5J07_18670 [Achromobacter mucicolens]|uniref:DUF6708 domain-containing protein n=1 Tax=Achromobacter mucicolens TaxID=1389922 RepID=UPI0020A23CCE|nr:DUF6708 domain-containing protein [Achromobacter mucicolens]MCP2516972.1 hypothetical protein [Achromobacter mucicolens]
MRTKQVQQPRPSFMEIQRNWRLFRFASTLLSLCPDASDAPAIEAIRVNEYCIEVVSDTLQKGSVGVNLQTFTFSGLFSLLFAVVGGFGGWSLGVVIFSLGLPILGILLFLVSSVLGPRYRYRCSKVRFNRRSRRVYYVPYPEESSETIWELAWDRVQGISWMTGLAQPYLYLVGYTCNLPEPQLVKIPVMSNEKIHAEHIWAWLNRFMAKDEDLPLPQIIQLPQKPTEVLMRNGGHLVMWSLTTRKGRRFLPLMIWVDLAILLLYMPSRALPQLIILQYPEIQFPEENNRHCGFSTD